MKTKSADKKILSLTAMGSDSDSQPNTALYLGTWCTKGVSDPQKSYVHYHWVDYGKKRRDKEYLDGLIRRVVAQVGNALNRAHSLEYSERYWNVLLTGWVATILHVTFDRWEVIEQFHNNETAADFCYPSFYSAVEHLPPDELDDCPDLYLNDGWNQYIFEKILGFRNMCQPTTITSDWYVKKNRNSWVPSFHNTKEFLLCSVCGIL